MSELVHSTKKLSGFTESPWIESATCFDSLSQCLILLKVWFSDTAFLRSFCPRSRSCDGAPFLSCAGKPCDLGWEPDGGTPQVKNNQEKIKRSMDEFSDRPNSKAVLICSERVCSSRGRRDTGLAGCPTSPSIVELRFLFSKGHLLCLVCICLSLASTC